MRGHVAQATAKWFNRENGFGFITQAGTARIFAHFSAFTGAGDRLEDVQAVEFDVARGPKRLRAQNVRKNN